MSLKAGRQRERERERERDGPIFHSGGTRCGGGNGERRTPTGRFENYVGKILWGVWGGSAHSSDAVKQLQ